MPYFKVFSVFRPCSNAPVNRFVVGSNPTRGAWKRLLGMPTLPRPLSLLTVSVGEQSWNLEQDFNNRERWLHLPDPDRLRGWS